MQVSAITANAYLAYGLYDYRQDYVNVRGLDVPQEPASDTYTPSSKGNSLSESKLFDNINEWKYFCHRQIAAGKLDIIV